MKDPQLEKLRAYQRDFPLYAREQLKIHTKDGHLAPFELNRAQRRLWALVEEDLDARRPVRHYYLKARQLGTSTFCQGLKYWRCSLNKHQKALTTSHEDLSASELFSKQSVFFRYTDEWIRPKIKRTNRQELYFTDPKPEKTGLESKMIVQTANNRNLGASQTLQFIHMSEFARYEALLQDVTLTMASLMPTIPYAPNTFVFIETTAQGMGYAKDMWDADNEYRKVFVSWIADDGYTSDEPVDPSTISPTNTDPWGNEEEVLHLVHQELEFWYPELDQKERFDEALNRLAWRRQQIRSIFNGDRDLFKQEYPLTAEEAFLTSGNSVFDPRKLGDLLAWAEADPTSSLGFRLDESETPVKWREAPNGPLRVYKRPEPRAVYVIGADASYGTESGDYSAAQVFKVPEFEQVAVFHERLPPDEFADKINALGRWYNLAHIAPEVDGPGLAMVLRLYKTHLYPNLYRRQSFDQRSKSYRNQVGWVSSGSTKPVLVSTMLGMFNEDSLVLRDVPTLKEMAFFVEQPGKSSVRRFGAVPGKHDDLVMSLGMALQMARQLGPVGIKTKESSGFAPGTVGYEVWRSAESDEVGRMRL